MPDYTEAAIHTLSGVDLDTAIANEIEKDDLTANTDERIDEACTQWAWKNQWEWFGDGDNPAWFGVENWNAREGQPWQSDLEQHVANWRATAGPYPLEWCVMNLMGHQWELVKRSNDYRCDSFHDAVAVVASDPATAIKRAACIVELRRKGDNTNG